MTDMFEKQPSPDVSNYASSSGLSGGDDKEIGYRAATFKHQYLLANKSTFHFSPFKIDLNFARMVRVYCIFNPSMYLECKVFWPKCTIHDNLRNVEMENVE